MVAAMQMGAVARMIHCEEDLFEGGIRVPTFIVSPHIQGGTTNENLMHMSDWFPTLCNLAGIKSGFDLDGYNVWETIR